MIIISPQELTQGCKKIFRDNISSLPMKAKWGVLILIALFAVNDYVGFTHCLIVNSKIDNIQHLQEITINGVEDKTAEVVSSLQTEILNRTNIFQRTVANFSFCDDGKGRLTFINTLTVAIVPFLLILVGLYYFILTIVRRRDDKPERLINLFILGFFTFLLFHAMVWISWKIPTIPGGFEWGNYLINTLLSVILYLVLCAVITEAVKTTDANPIPTSEEPAAPERNNNEVSQEQEEENVAVDG